jgi:hypothetical protein
VYVDVIDATRPQKAIGVASPREAENIIAATYRVRPDRRFLLAVADIQELKSGRRVPVRLDFSGRRWQIQCGDRNVGELPEIPDFSDGLQLLTAWAATLPSPTGSQTISAATLQSMDSEVAAFGAPSLFRAMQRIKVRNASPDLPALRTLSRAMTLLNLQVIDRMGLADPVRARALAVIAMARSMDATTGAEEVAVMANVMGYEKEAKQLLVGVDPRSFAAVWVGGTPIQPDATQDAATRYAGLAVALRNANKNNPEGSLRPWLSKLETPEFPLLLMASAFENNADRPRCRRRRRDGSA